MSSDFLGSARWDTFQGYEKEQVLAGNSFIIGNPMIDPYRSDANLENFLCLQPARHLISVAPTRSGKGISLIIPNLLHYRGSTIVIDPKGENAWITAKYRREGLGQKTIILDPWGEVNRRYGDLAGEQERISRFNPLSILDPESEHYADDLAYLADALIINQGKDPHWDDSARELVAGLIAYTVEKYKEKATLPMVRLLLSKPAEAVTEIAKEAQQYGFESVAARKLGRFVNQSREISSILSTALTQTAFLDSKTLSENLSESDFSFESLVTGTATIYLVLPVDKLQTYGRWLRLLISIGIRTVARNVKPLPLPVLFMLDEFGTIGRLSAVAQAYGLMAGLQMCIWAFVQDLVQLKRDYSEDWETFIGNSEAALFFNVMDQFTANFLSTMLGTETIERISDETAKKREGGMFLPGDQNYQQMKDQVFARALMQPAEVRGFPFGLWVGRHQPLRFIPIKYYEDPILLLRSRPDPHFPDMAKKRDSLEIEDINAQAVKKIPNYKAAVEFLKSNGYKVEYSGIISKKTVVASPTGEKKSFEDEKDFVKWVRSFA